MGHFDQLLIGLMLPGIVGQYVLLCKDAPFYPMVKEIRKEALKLLS